MSGWGSSSTVNSPGEREPSSSVWENYKWESHDDYQTSNEFIWETKSETSNDDQFHDSKLGSKFSNDEDSKDGKLHHEKPGSEAPSEVASEHRASEDEQLSNDKSEDGKADEDIAKDDASEVSSYVDNEAQGISNISMHAIPNDEAPTDSNCRNCGQPGHFARECTEPKKLPGECFNCGEIGHNKADCPNPKIDRPFTGECLYCHKEGHRISECPEKGPDRCRNCLEEGHRATECTQPRVVDTSTIEDLDKDTAWSMLEKANKECDLDEFKDAVKIYCKACQDLTYIDLEKKFREAGFGVYIIAMELEVPKAMTVVNLQGKSDCKYIVSYSTSVRPKRKVLAAAWPASEDDNLKRLEDAGIIMESTIPFCRNCGEKGHISKQCTNEKTEEVRDERYDRCNNCMETGHSVRDCTKPRMDIADRGKTCRNCNKSGHLAADCPEPRSASGVECNSCHEKGHFSRDCPNRTGADGDNACRKCGEGGHFARDCPNNDSGPARGCHNCGEEGHISRECDKPKNPANVTCRNCDQVGHFSRECPLPTDWSRVKCSYCEEMGHTIKRCAKAAAGDSRDGFGQNNFDTEHKGSGDAAETTNGFGNKGRDGGFKHEAVSSGGVDW